MNLVKRIALLTTVGSSLFFSSCSRQTTTVDYGERIVEYGEVMNETYTAPTTDIGMTVGIDFNGNPKLTPQVVSVPAKYSIDLESKTGQKFHFDGSGQKVRTLCEKLDTGMPISLEYATVHTSVFEDTDKDGTDELISRTFEGYHLYDANPLPEKP